MNTQYLQHHLECQVSCFARQCTNEGLEDNGLICELFAHEELSDEIRLSYIQKIECELSRCGCRCYTRPESSYLACVPEESQRKAKQKKWDELHEMAISLTRHAAGRKEKSVREFLEKVSTSFNPTLAITRPYE